MTGYSKPLILGVVQSWVEDFVQFCNFPQLLRDLLAYDEEYIGTDWDSVDALAYAIMRINDMKTRPRKSSEIMAPKYDDPEWTHDQNGNAILKSDKNSKGTKKFSPSELSEGQGRWRPGYSYENENSDPDIKKTL